MSLLQLFTEYVRNENLFDSNNHLLLAVSGGMDSSVLCKLTYQAGFDFEIAHCNFQLRGEESERDEIFVLGLGESYRKKVHVKRFDSLLYASQNKVSVQVAAREQRYEWFREWSTRKAIRILTAHHLDDNIETLLMNFFKGTGIKGLRAILPKQGSIVRPLLFAKKEEIRQFADSNDLNWVEDSSNELDKYTRNYFRHQIIPLIQKVYPETIQNLGDNLERFRDIEDLYEQSVRRYKKELYHPEGEEIHIPVLKLKKVSPLRSLVYEIIKEFNFSSSQVGEVIGLMDSDTGKYISSSTHRIIKNRNWFIITPLRPGLSKNTLIEESDKSVIYENGKLDLVLSEINHCMENADVKLSPSTQTAYIDADQVQYPLVLRKWRTGDYFYPLGMPKKKKLGRFFIDNKFSLADKQKIWILEMNKKIIWIVGHRIDDRFKVTPMTKKVLTIKNVAHVVD